MYDLVLSLHIEYINIRFGLQLADLKRNPKPEFGCGNKQKVKRGKKQGSKTYKKGGEER